MASKLPDENDLLRARALPVDPEADAVVMTAPGSFDAEREARVRASVLTVAEAVDAFARRLENPAAGVLMPWPGTTAERPTFGAATLTEQALLPRRGGYTSPAWQRIAELIGPLFPDRLAVLVGGTGRGKSALAVQVAEAVARAGFPVLYASAEMGTDELVARLIALRARGPEADPNGWGVPYAAILRATGSADAQAVRNAGAALVQDCGGLHLWAPSADIRGAAGLQTAARIVSERHGGAAALIVLDYVQRFAPNDDERRLAVSALSGALRDLSRPGGLGHSWPGAAVLALSSTARNFYQAFDSTDALRRAFAGDPKERVPLEGSGKETGELEFDAALLLCLTTDRGNDTPDARDGLLVVPKNRHGRTGMVRLRFAPACGKFEEGPDASPRRAEPDRPRARERAKGGSFEGIER